MPTSGYLGYVIMCCVPWCVLCLDVGGTLAQEPLCDRNIPQYTVIVYSTNLTFQCGCYPGCNAYVCIANMFAIGTTTLGGRAGNFRGNSRARHSVLVRQVVVLLRSVVHGSRRMRGAVLCKRESKASQSVVTGHICINPPQHSSTRAAAEDTSLR